MTRDLQRSIVALASSIPLALASSCDLFGGIFKPADIDATAPYVRFIEEGEDIDLSLYADQAGRSAYVVLTTGSSGAATKPEASSRDIATLERSAVSEVRDRGEAATEWIRKKALSIPLEFGTSSRYLKFYNTGVPSEDEVNTPSDFAIVGPKDEQDKYTTISIPAKCKLVLKDVVFSSTVRRSLSIWVADDCWDSAPSKRHGVTDDMVKALADQFFGEAGASAESIYAWVTNILGDEWGTHRYSNLIGASDNVTILLADIASDNSDTGGIVGYFNPGDTVAVSDNPASNERVMFVIDAVMYANPDDGGAGIQILNNGILQPNQAYSDNGWAPTDYWAETVFSTLAHEFQHMIHFYQKAVLRGANTAYEPTWIDELCSMQIEDLLADRLGVPGPRGVAHTDPSAGEAGNTDGRLSDFVQFNDDSLADWDGDGTLADSLKSYAAAYAFGAYLTRNYGGAEFIRRVVQTADISPDAVAAAASAYTGKTETIEGLLKRWGAAVLLSSDSAAPDLYRYNKGGAFTSTVNGVEYRLGSINVWNYVSGGQESRGLLVFDKTNVGLAAGGALSNILLGLGDPKTNPDWTLKVPAGMYATVVID